MPELPEIIAHAERLGRAFAGAELAAFAPLHSTALKTFDPRPEMGKSADRPSNVHHRIGQPCTTCGDEVRSVTYRRYVVAYLL